jgi:hypothetical protein
MQSEHLTNVHPGWVVGGWMVSVAVTSAVYIAFVGLGLASGTGSEAIWDLVAVVVGFFVGGFFVGIRWTEAPILHGLVFGLVSVVFLLVVNLVAPETGEAGMPLGGSTSLVLSVILVQVFAAMAGGFAGRRVATGGIGGGDE